MPDPLVRARDVLLDRDEMTARLARLLAVDGALRIDGYRRRRAKYRVGESLWLVHELEIGGALRVVSTGTLPGRSAEVYERALERATDADGLRAVAHDPELETVVWTYPNDRTIAGLVGIAPSTDLLSRLLGRPVARTVLVAYAPEESATVACLDDDGIPIAYAKLFASVEDAAAARDAHAALFAQIGRDHSMLRVPAPLAWSPDDRLLVVEAFHGRRVDALRGPDVLLAMRRFGAAVASLHSVPVADGLAPFERLAPARQAEAADVIGRVRPDVAAVAGALADELLEAARPAEPAVLLHGDVQPRNGLVVGRRIALVDLHRAGLGQPAIDLGGTLAGLRYRAIVDDERARGERLSAALMEGYASRRDVPHPAVLCWHVAAALLTERALRAIDGLRPEGLDHLGEILSDARAILSDARAVLHAGAVR